MFAVAVFLFGYSLTPQGRKRRRLFARVATLFASYGGLWAAVYAAGGMPDQPLAAASAYADGKVDANDNEYALADRNFTRARKLRPKFVEA